MLSVVFGASALAQDPQVDAIVKALTPDRATLGAGDATLGIDIIAKQDPGPVAVLELIDKSEAPSITVIINFEFNSAELTEKSKQSIDLVAKAMNQPSLGSFAFLVGGHTDGKGSDDINDALSRRRAQAVVDYLALAGSVDPSRLIAYGFGERHLRTPDDPFAAENRRVQFVTLEGQ